MAFHTEHSTDTKELKVTSIPFFQSPPHPRAPLFCFLTALEQAGVSQPDLQLPSISELVALQDGVGTDCRGQVTDSAHANMYPILLPPRRGDTWGGVGPILAFRWPSCLQEAIEEVSPVTQCGGERGLNSLSTCF